MKKKFKVFTSVLLTLGLLAGCSDSKSTSSSGNEKKSGEKVVLTLWRGQGTDGEEALHKQQVADFNKQSKEVEIKEEVFPYNEFTNTIRAATSTNTLPDIMFMDGTVVANMAQLDAIVPVDENIDSNVKTNFSASAFVKYNGKTYGLNEQEGGLGLWANKGHLTKAGVRIPTYEQPWTKDEFKDVLSKLKKVDGVKFPLDMKINYGGDYVVYAWQPIIRSFGGNWWDENSHKVEGTLNGDKTVKAYNYIKDLVKAGYVNNKQTEDTLLVSKKASLDLTGHWNYPSYKAALKDDLILLPLPDFGEGSYTGVGGISFTVSKAAADKGYTKQAMEFINFALGDQYQQKVNTANGSLPANLNILKSLDAFKPGGDLHLYQQQLEGKRFVVRPESPSFPTFQSEVGKATLDILSGASINKRLKDASKAIEQVISDNEGNKK